jgi:hypothetical protein
MQGNMKIIIRLLTMSSNPSVIAFGRGSSFARAGACWAGLAIAVLAGASTAAAQSDKQMVTLAGRSSIVVLGTITKVGASEEPILAPTNATVVIKIEQMFAGSEIAGDQTGRTATVIVSKPGDVKVGTKALFFGNPRFVGKTMTIADVGELPASAADERGAQALAPALQAKRDAPVRARLDIAQVVFRGTVESVRPLEQESKDRKPELRNEHDPEWQVAMVRVISAVRGTQNGAVVPVLFAASSDIMWFKSPKPKPGEEKLFIGHGPQESEKTLLRATSVSSFIEKEHPVLVTAPFDVLPPSDEKRVVGLLEKKAVP